MPAIAKLVEQLRVGNRVATLALSDSVEEHSSGL
jgi:hypothetical protein